jgi:mannan endo-1,4-beta-mannosidase
MKILHILLLSVVGLVTASPFPLNPGSQVKAANGTFASVSGLKFNIDGSTAYFAGTNTYWIGFLTNNADVDTVMGHLQSSGLKVLRVWGAFLPSHSTPRLTKYP